MRPLLVAGLLVSLALGARAEVNTFEKPPASIEGSTRHVFKTVKGFALPIYVFAPPEGAARPAPAIVFFHGSGWHSGTLTQFVEHARALAKLGMVAAVAEYRVKLDYDATPFEGLADVKSAVRWMRAHASELGADPRRVAAAGGSAGAHLALVAGLLPAAYDEPGEDASISSRPDLLVLFAAVTDLTPSVHDPQPNPLFGGRELELSPIHLLRPGTATTPIVMFQGSDDTWALPERARTFADALEAAGGACDLILFEGRGHCFYNHPSYYRRYPRAAPLGRANDYDLCLLLTTRFLHDHGFLKIRPSVPAADSTAPAP